MVDPVGRDALAVREKQREEDDECYREDGETGIAPHP